MRELLTGLFEENVNFSTCLVKIEEDGVYGVLAKSSKPYLDALWYNFSDERPTVTEDVVSGKMISRIWAWICGWWRRK